jgi:hypothetical protein
MRLSGAASDVARKDVEGWNHEREYGIPCAARLLAAG